MCDIVSWLKVALKLYILLTLCYCLFKKTPNKLLVMLLVIASINIIISDILLYNNIKIALNNNLYIIISFVLWFMMFKEITKLKEVKYVIILFLLFSLYNLFFIESYNKLNTKTFVCGTFFYLLLFVYICVVKLKKEQLDFFINNNFIIITSPILFFVGYSLMFGFKNKILNDVILFGTIKLFDIISNVVNFTFYTLVNVYIYKENKQKCMK